MPGLLGKAFWSLAGLGGLWAVFVSLLATPWAQREAVYAFRFHTAWLQSPNQPMAFGFARNQVQPFNITTPDHETLYAWHVLPSQLYAENEDRLLESPLVEQKDSLAFQMLQNPNARLVISFHGNAGHVAQHHRPTHLSTLASLSRDIHILSIDYRGFGHSTGMPCESGLVSDGIATVNWALHTARIPASRILLVGHSLGTAVTAAVLEHFALTTPMPLAGAVLMSGFSTLPALLRTYAVLGFVPVLSPLKRYPRVRAVLEERIVDRWNTTDRLARVVSEGKVPVRVQLLHARNDFDIPWTHSDKLFEALTGEGEIRRLEDGGRGRSGNWEREWKGKGAWVKQSILEFGGHNRIIMSPALSLAVRRGFEAAQD